MHSGARGRSTGRCSGCSGQLLCHVAAAARDVHHRGVWNKLPNRPFPLHCQGHRVPLERWPRRCWPLGLMLLGTCASPVHPTARGARSSRLGRRRCCTAEELMFLRRTRARTGRVVCLRHHVAAHSHGSGHLVSHSEQASAFVSVNCGAAGTSQKAVGNVGLRTVQTCTMQPSVPLCPLMRPMASSAAGPEGREERGRAVRRLAEKESFAWN